MRAVRVAAATAAGSVVAVAGYVGVVTGRLTVDLGVGRRTRPLGPTSIRVKAPRQAVFDAAAAPYAARPTRAMQAKVKILERGSDMLLAAHHTAVSAGLTAVTVETVALDPPREIRFQLVRGPVPSVQETFTFEAHEDGSTTLTYEGTLGTDLWALGQAWGNVVAKSWEAAVAKSLDEIKTACEQG